jgi:hypothetical protein
MPSGYIIGALFSTIILFIWPVKFIFAFIAIVVFSALIPAFLLEDNKCEKELLPQKTA